jgi:type VI secretion system Hcp family effector
VDNVPVLSFSQRVDVASSIHVPAGSTAGAVTVSAIQITRYSDSSSPIVSLQAAQGTVIPTATIMLAPRNVGGQTVYMLAITLTNVLVNQVGTDSTQNTVPLEKISLSFDQIKWEFTARDADNNAGPTTTTTYDVRQRLVQGSSAFFPTFVYSSSYDTPIGSEDNTPFSSLALQLSNSATGTGAGSGTATVSPLSLVVPVFQDTLGEFGSALKGTSAPLVTAHYALTWGGAPVDRLVYQLTNALVVSVAIDTTSTGSLQETLGFDFTKIKWTATSVTAGQGGGQVVEAEWPPTKTDH